MDLAEALGATTQCVVVVQRTQGCIEAGDLGGNRVHVHAGARAQLLELRFVEVVFGSDQDLVAHALHRNDLELTRQLAVKIDQQRAGDVHREMDVEQLGIAGR